LFEDLAESSELFLQNNYGNEKSMIRQVATLRVMGVAAQKVLQAGQNMVLNYKDSIKAEMKLSALLGKQVDLSRVRQQFASGDAAGAAQTLRAQLKGIDMDKMNMFQRQALQEATGMDMDTVMKLGMGQPMGPLQLADFIGLDVCLAILNVMHDGFKNPKYAPCPLLVNMVRAGKLGSKSGEGFYDYSESKKAEKIAKQFIS
jgi:hypothetical protein